MQLVELEEFAAAVKENAEAVEERQETDSIPLVDDIRFHITSNVQTYSAIEEANQKLEALENLLASIGLECWCHVQSAQPSLRWLGLQEHLSLNVPLPILCPPSHPPSGMVSF